MTLLAAVLLPTVSQRNTPERSLAADMPDLQLVSFTGGLEPSNRTATSLAAAGGNYYPRADMRGSRNGQWVAYADEVYPGPGGTDVHTLRVANMATPQDQTVVATQLNQPYWT